MKLAHVVCFALSAAALGCGSGQRPGPGPTALGFVVPDEPARLLSAEARTVFDTAQVDPAVAFTYLKAQPEPAAVDRDGEAFRARVTYNYRSAGEVFVVRRGSGWRVSFTADAPAESWPQLTGCDRAETAADLARYLGTRDGLAGAAVVGPPTVPLTAYAGLAVDEDELTAVAATAESLGAGVSRVRVALSGKPVEVTFAAEPRGDKLIATAIVAVDGRNPAEYFADRLRGKP